ncbi:MAG TPA: PEGA domain-containing protein [Thermoanaerobaculia bacterium]|nr:PEGA domain-containing protein [Thermoanaerobaculia bacterium]
MKRLTLSLAFAALALVVVADPLSAAPRGRHRGGGRSHGRATVIIRPSWGWGWGWGFGGWYDPYWYGYGPYYRPYDRYGYGRPGNWAVVDTDVSPESARVYLDGQYIGTADDFDGYPDYLYLRRGQYRLEFRLDGFETRAIDVDARPGVKIDVDDKLARVPGAPRYGDYDTPEPRGGVRRFWGKRRDASVEVTEDEMSGDDRPYYRERPPDREDSEEEYSGDRDRDRRDMDVDRGRPSGDEWRGRGEAEQSDTRIVLEIQPADASVYLDDRFIGAASELGSDGGVAVAPGHHTLIVSRPGYRDRRVEVDVSPGETENVRITLER